ncbi:sperm-associated antigen 8 [Erinaceus europaeus]|uniref:Sperm-associated antigen 8 n=1 Tax=Erinaceus europaeus TaxID=9365 RepID=A0A1S3WB06_ERIEU|nr:sperm-associated antigen 8 [Erinaceus europaeus]
METDAEAESPSEPLGVQPSSSGRESTSGPFPSLDGVSTSSRAVETTATVTPAAATPDTKTAAVATDAPVLCPEPSLGDSSSETLEDPYPSSHFAHKIDQEGLDVEPTHHSSFARGQDTTNVHSSRPGAVPASSSDLYQDRAPDTGHVLGCVSDPKICLRAKMCSNYVCCHRCCHCKPQKQPPWKDLQVSEPGNRGLWRPPEAEEECELLSKTLPRGQCLLYNWEEERATNHLDQVPSMHDGSESYFFRHGHQRLLTLQPELPMPVSTTQRDSYQPPRNHYYPLRGKREAMMEMLLSDQICKEVLAEQEPTKKLFEVESVTHHDYRKELAGAGPPAPTKPHDYRQEQPETFWRQKAPQLPGVSYIRTLDTPFRKNCSFSTPVPLSLGQPLPYEPEDYYHPLGETSSLACHGGGQGRTTPT